MMFQKLPNNQQKGQSGDSCNCPLPQELFQAVPTDVGICCAFNFNSTMKETVYARWEEHQENVKSKKYKTCLLQRLIAELKQKESKEERFKVLEVKKGKVGFDMGLKVFSSLIYSKKGGST